MPINPDDEYIPNLEYSNYDDWEQSNIGDKANAIISVREDAREKAPETLNKWHNRAAERKVDEQGGLTSEEVSPELHKNDDGTLKDTSEDYLKNKWNSLAETVGLDNDFRFDTYLAGQKVDTRNKSLFNKTFDYFDNDDKFKDYDLKGLKEYYDKAEDDPTAKHVFYTLKAYDGRDENGKKKYIYKTGVAEKSVFNRNKDKFGKGVYLVDFKRFAGAEQFEHALNRRAVIEKQNAFDLNSKHKLPEHLRSGFTEFVKTDILGVDRDDATKSDYYKKEQLAKRIHDDYIKNSFASDGSELDDGYEDALVSGGVKLANDIADLGLTAVGYLGNVIGLENNLKDNIFDKWSKNADDIAGYDARGAKAALTESIQSFKDGDYAGAVTNDFFTKLEFIAQSAPELMMLFGTGGASGAAKLSAEATKAVSAVAKHRTALAGLTEGTAAFKTAKAAEAAATSTLMGLGVKGKQLDYLLKTSSVMGKIKHVSAPSTYKLLVAKNTNNIIEERREAGDKDVTMIEVAVIAASQAVMTGLDKLSLKGIVGNKGISSTLRDSFNILPKKLKANVLTKMASVSASLALSAGQEAAQEYVQTWGEILGKNVGVKGKSFSDVLNDAKAQDEALGGALIGGVGGVAFGAIGKTVSGAKGLKRSPNEVKAEVVANEPIPVEPIEALDNDNYKKIDTVDTVFDPTFNDEDTMTSILKHLDDSEPDHTIKDLTPKDIVKFTGTLGKNATRFYHNVASVVDNNRRILAEQTEGIKGSSIDLKPLYKGNQDFRDRIDGIADQAMTDFIIDAHTVATSTSEDIKGSSAADPRLNQITNLIRRFQHYAKVAESQGLPIKDAPTTMDTLKRYHTAIKENGSIETFNKIASDVSTEIETLGFVTNRGSLHSDRGSIRGFRSHLVSTLEGAVNVPSGINNKYSLSSLGEFVASRVKKANKGLYENKNGNTDGFVANVGYENHLLRNTLVEAKDAIQANTDISEHKKSNYLTEIDRQLSQLAEADHKLLKSHAKGDKVPRQQVQATEAHVEQLVQSMNNATSPKSLETTFAIGNKANNVLGHKQLTGLSDKDASRIIQAFGLNKRRLKKKAVEPVRDNNEFNSGAIQKPSKPVQYLIPDNVKPTMSDEDFVDDIDNTRTDSVEELEAQIKVRLAKGQAPANVKAINKTLVLFKKLQETKDMPISVQTLAFKEMVDRALFVINNATNNEQITLAWKALSGDNLPFAVLHRVVKAIDAARIRITPTEEQDNNTKDKSNEPTPEELLANEREALLSLRDEIINNEFTEEGTTTLKNLKLFALNTINKNFTKLDKAQKALDKAHKDKKMAVVEAVIKSVRQTIETLHSTIENLYKSNKELDGLVKAIGKYLDKIGEGKGLRKGLQQEAALSKVQNRIDDIDKELGTTTPTKEIPKNTKPKPKKRKKNLTKKQEQKERIGQLDDIPIGGNEYEYSARQEAIKNEDTHPAVDQGLFDHQNIEYIQDTYPKDFLEIMYKNTKTKSLKEVLGYILDNNTTFTEKSPDEAITILERTFPRYQEAQVKKAKHVTPKKEVPKEVTKKTEPKVEPKQETKPKVETKTKEVVTNPVVEDSPPIEFFEEQVEAEIALQDSLASISFENETAVGSVISKELLEVTANLDIIEVTPEVRSKVVTLIKDTEELITKDLETIDKLNRSVRYNDYKTNQANRVTSKLEKLIEDTITSRSDKIRELATIRDTQSSYNKSIKYKLDKGTLTDKQKEMWVRSTKTRDKRIAKLEKDIASIDKNLDTLKAQADKARFKTRLDTVARVKQSIKKRLKKLVFDIRRLMKRVSGRRQDVEYLQEILNRMDTVGELTKEDSQYLSTALVDTTDIKSNGESIVETLGIKEVEANKTALSKIPSMVKSFDEKGVPSLVNAVFKDNKNIDKLLPALAKLNGFYKNLKLAPSLTIVGKTTELVKGKFVNTKGKNYVNALEIFSQQMETAKGVKYLKYQEEVSDALSVGVVGAIASVSKVRTDLLNKDREDLIKDLGINDSDVDKYLDMVHRGYIPDVLIGEEVVDVVKDIIGVKFTESDVTTPALYEASIKSMVIQQLKHGKMNKQNIVEQTVRVPFSNGKSINFTKLNKDLLSKEDLTELTASYIQLSYLSESGNRALPSPTPLDVKEDETVMHSHVKLSDEKKEFLQKAQSIEWKFNDDVTDLADQYSKQPEAVLKAFGYVEITNDTPVTEIKKIKSINDKVVREVESLIDVKDMYTREDGTTDSFFLKWGITKSFRQNIRGVINYQESKIHREFTYTDAYISKVYTGEKQDVVDINADNLSNTIMFELALSQALGLDPDKKSVRAVVSELREIVDIYNDNGIQLKGDRLSGIKAFVEADSVDYSLLGDSAYNIEGMHTVKAALELRKLHQAKQKGAKGFETTLTLEADAITSGTILQMLQLGTKKAMEIAALGGVWTKERAKKFEKYTRNILSQKYNVPESEVEFNSSSLIEAGQYHQNNMENVMRIRREKSRYLKKESKIALYKFMEGMDNYEQTGNPDVLDDLVKQYKDILNMDNVMDFMRINPRMMKNVGNSLSNDTIDEILAKSSKDTVSAYNFLKNRELNSLPIKTLDTPFLDIYTSVGQKVLDYISVRSTKDMSEALKELVNVTGELTLSTIRKISKSPVMVFNYGSSLNSIKRKVAEETVHPHFINNNVFRDKVLKEMVKEEALNDIGEFYNNLSNFRIYKDEMLTVPTQEEFNTIDPKDYSKHIVITDSAVLDKLKSLSNKFLGNAYEQVFEETFGELSDMRTGMKIADTLVAASFKEELDNRVSKLIETKDVITKEDIIEVIRGLEKDGLGHTIDINGVPQPLYNTDKSEGDLQASVSLNPATTSTSTAIEGRDVTANTGAAATITIHRIDGEIIARAIADNDFGNIYDAILFRTNHKDVQKGANNYQKEVVNVSTSYRNHTSYVTKAIDMVSKLSPDTLYSMLTPISRGKKVISVSERGNRIALRTTRYIRGKNVVQAGFSISNNHTASLKYHDDSINVDYTDSTGHIKKTVIANRVEGSKDLYDVEYTIAVNSVPLKYASKKATTHTYTSNNVKLDTTSHLKILEGLDTNLMKDNNLTVRVEKFTEKGEVSKPLESVLTSINSTGMSLKTAKDSFVIDSLNRLGVSPLNIQSSLVNSIPNQHDYALGSELVVNHLGLAGTKPQTIKVNKKKDGDLSEATINKLRDIMSEITPRILRDITEYITNKYKDSTSPEVQEFLQAMASTNTIPELRIDYKSTKESGGVHEDLLNLKKTLSELNIDMGNDNDVAIKRQIKEKIHNCKG